MTDIWTEDLMAGDLCFTPEQQAAAWAEFVAVLPAATVVLLIALGVTADKWRPEAFQACAEHMLAAAEAAGLVENRSGVWYKYVHSD